MKTIITASNLCFMDFIWYPDIEIQENKVTFICGKSGCGKSTLLKLLNATLTPSEGKIFFNEDNIEKLDTIQYRRNVLLVSQEIYLFDESIKENFNIYYKSRDTKLIEDKEILFYLSLCCADFPLDTSCSTLSGGEKQRVFLAICLSFCPKVLMLDEPTSALDPKTAEDLLLNIKTFCTRNNITLVIICHDQILVDTFADKIINLEKEAFK